MTAQRVRIGVIGLGAMGRHHARILPRLRDVVFIGGVDPAGDTHLALAGHPLYDDLGALLAAGADAAVVAVPSGDHEKVAVRLAEEGVHSLIEKPLASDIGSAKRICDAFATTGLVAAVGHVERFNPAMRELKLRLERKALGRVFSIKTERVGPYPLRVKDVGVVQDLATHDLDLVLWLAGPIDRIEVELGHRLGHPQEDLLEAVGRLSSGAVVTISVNWLTPTKRRTVTVLGERGALVADLLSADLTFFTNAQVPTEWDEMARLRGVAEGDMVRYALRKQEPLQAELESFRDAVLGDPQAEIVTLDEGLAVMAAANRILESGGTA